MIKVGQIGIGHNHGEAVMRTVRRFPELFEVIGYSEENEEWLRRRAGKPGYENLPRLTEDEIIERSDAVIVETDVWNLTATAKKCIDAGNPVHMDKPASGTMEEYKALLDAAEKKGLPLQLGYMYRYNPAVIKCMEWQKEGRFGDIYSIHAEMNTCHDAASRRWHGNFNGGVHYILGSPLVDLIVWFFGETREGDVFPAAFRQGRRGRAGQQPVRSGIPERTGEDRGLLCRRGRSQPPFLRHFGQQGNGRHSAAMTYSDLSIATNAFENHSVPVELVSNGRRYDQMMKDFHDFVVGKKENPYSYAHEYAVQEVLSEVVGGVRMLGNKI